MVAIKDFEMPKKCIWDCPLCNEEGGACQLSDVKTSGVKRPSDCPLVEAIPKAEYEARFKTGKWIVHRKSDGEVGYFQCSSCDHHSVVKFPYCPICGAEMDCNPNILSEMKAIPRDMYENRLKADMVAMLEEIDLKFEELTMNTCEFDVSLGYRNIIEQKINALKEEKNDV